METVVVEAVEVFLGTTEVEAVELVVVVVAAVEAGLIGVAGVAGVAALVEEGFVLVNGTEF